MALLSSSLAGEVAIRLLFSPLGSKVFARWACVVGGLAFPVYSSFKAIELKNKLEQDHWLYYWTVYGCFNVVEIFSDKLLFWFPGYYHAKLIFLIWLQLPLTAGARQILTNNLRPLFSRYQATLDSIVNGTRADLNTFLLAHLSELMCIKSFIGKVIRFVFTAMGNACSSLRNSAGSCLLSSTVNTGRSGSVHSIPGHEQNVSSQLNGSVQSASEEEDFPSS